MTDDQKLQFIQNMTKHALDHVSKAPDVPGADGKMSHDKKMQFVLAMAKHGLKPMAAGGVLGAIGNALGTTNNFQAATANITPGTDASQLQGTFEQQQGAQNQEQTATAPLVAGSQSAATQQNQLAQDYTNQINGTGPNPAAAELNQATGQNIAQQAALAANTRGSSSNAGAIAANNAQQGAATQQNAVGTAATTEAEQQIAAEQNLQNLSATQASQAVGATSSLNQGVQSEQNILQNANTAANNANVAMTSNANNTNLQAATANQQGATGLLGGIANGASSLVSGIASLFEKGGTVKAPLYMKKMASGGSIHGADTGGAPKSYAAQWLTQNTNTSGPQMEPSVQIAQQDESALQKKGGGSGKPPPDAPSRGLNSQDTSNMVTGQSAGATQALSPVATDLNPMADTSNIQMTAYKGGLAAKGGKVMAPTSSQKAKISGDSLQNDKIPAMLSEGEVVIDRDTLNDKGPIGQMARALKMHIENRNRAS